MPGRIALRELPDLREILDRGVEIAISRFAGDGPGVLSSGSADPSRKQVALSFDDGPSPHNTPHILDILQRHGARATFFVVGDRIAGQGHLLQRMIREGHEVGNHTYTHQHTVHLSRRELREEIERTNELIRSLASSPPKVIRPPFGKDRRRIGQISRELGMKMILWSVDSGDTRGYSPAGITRAVTSKAKAGAIILLHDGGGRRSETLAATEEILGALRARGFECVTVSELLGSGNGA